MLNDHKESERRESGICWLYSDLTGDERIYFRFKLILPELYAKAKDVRGWYMWDNWKERRQALAECIEETANF
jgi:hypothetical protein